MYVPAYSPAMAYGPWPYPDEQPYYFPPPPGYYYDSGAITYWTFFPVVEGLWGWNRWDWRHHHINIDDRRYAAINGGRSSNASGVWTHDPAHRPAAAFPAAISPVRTAARQNYRAHVPSAEPDVIHPNLIVPIPVPYTPPPAGTDVIHPSLIMHPQVQAQSRPTAPMFESSAHGKETRAHAERGAASRAGTAPPPHEAAHPAAKASVPNSGQR